MTRARDTAGIIQYNVITVDSNDAVGIGSSIPDAKLDINGGLRVTGVGTFENSLIATGTNHDLNGSIALDHVTISGIATFQSNLRLGNDDKIQFGDSQNFSIYYNSSQGECRFEPAGGDATVIMGTTINLESLTSETYLNANANGAVYLYYDNAAKFETTGGGINVTGIVTATSFSGDGSNLENLNIPAVFDWRDSSLF